MIKKRFLKVVTAFTCIVALMIPYTNTIISVAASLTNDSASEVNSVNLVSLEYHEGGAESTGSLPDEYEYDERQYQYNFLQTGTPGTAILKIVQEDEKNSGSYSDAFYCVDASKSFPTVNNGEIVSSIAYKRTVSDFFAENPTTLGLSDANYNSLCWLLDNMYLSKQMTAEQRAVQKDTLIQNAFKSIIEDTTTEDRTTVDDIKARITDDDIEVIQQWAIWYFTNGGTDETGKTLQNVNIVKKDSDGNYILPTIEKEGITGTADNMEGTEYTWLNVLYQYFIKEAKSHGSSEYTVKSSGTYPTIANKTVSFEKDGDNYKVGPFNITAPEGLSSSDYEITLTDGTSEILSSKYTIKDANTGNEISDKKINEIFDKDFYVYIPTSENITTVKLNLSYTKFGTKASLWTSDATYQPLVLVTKEGDNERDSVEAKLETEEDLALRKYIVKVNDKTITDRTPEIDTTELASGKSTTATYNHQKEPVEVKVGDTITYRISVYNEGNVEAKEISIADYLPTGLEMIAVESNETNKNNGWVAEEVKKDDKVIGTVAKTSFTVNEGLQGFNTRTNTLSHVDVDIVCKVTGDVAEGSVFTNFAKIIADDIDDRDSQPTIADTDMKSSSYIGTSGETDLTKKDFFYKGEQDDDDFEKVKVIGKAFDLSLQKFITKVNGENVNPSREPAYNTTPLKNGLTDATYGDGTEKTPVLVSKGDIVTYTIRVYNEGEVDGYAEMVSDYLESGLGFLVNYKDNIENSWAIDEVAELKMNTLKLSDIDNGTKNLKLDDFTGVTDLKNVDVVVGNDYLSLTSKLLSSSSSSNLIKAYDGSDKLDYKDIEITCIVLKDNTGLNNYAEITKDSDYNKAEVEDRDSKPADNKPWERTEGSTSKVPNSEEDDWDYELLTTKKFDLSLQKFITGLNNTEIKDREPVPSYSNGDFTYVHPATALEVNNGDSVTYTIRVYNEGDMDGYAAQVADDIPTGLTFDSSNETNKKYEWVMYDASGNITTDASKAVEVRTDYLSKEKSDVRGDKCIQAFDKIKGDLYYTDVKVVFKVDTSASDITLTNTAEITKNTDSDGNNVEDIDSIPDNKKDGEDDIDKERVHVGYFDMALKKDLTKAIVTVGDSTTEYNAVNGQLLKVDIHRKKVNSTIVKFAYNITVTNEGTIAGYVKEIKDYIPEGLEFVESDNENWSGSGNTITTDALKDTLLSPGESATVPVILRWVNGEDNLGVKVNVAEISEDYNDANDVDDIDSTPDNKVNGEDDIDDAEVILSISTGSTPKYTILWMGVLVIMGTGLVLIKKFVL